MFKIEREEEIPNLSIARISRTKKEFVDLVYNIKYVKYWDALYSWRIPNGRIISLHNFSHFIRRI